MTLVGLYVSQIDNLINWKEYPNLNLLRQTNSFACNCFVSAMSGVVLGQPTRQEGIIQFTRI